MRVRAGLVALAAAGVAAAAFVQAGQAQHPAAPTAAQPALLPPLEVRASPNEPLVFAPNVGQAASHVAYVARSERQSVELRPTGATLTFAGSGPRIAVDLVGADPQVRMTTAERVAGGPDEVTTYATVIAEQALPGIDLAWHDEGGDLGYALRVVPGAEVDEIRMAVTGIERLTLDPTGTLLLHTMEGTFRQDPPFAYQEIDGQRHAVVARYLLEGDRFGFTVGVHDPTRPLIIDPVMRALS